MKRNIFQKLVNGGKTLFNVFRGATTEIEAWYPTNTSRSEPDVVLLHIGSNDINNQTKDKINT